MAHFKPHQISSWNSSHDWHFLGCCGIVRILKTNKKTFLHVGLQTGFVSGLLLFGDLFGFFGGARRMPLSENVFSKFTVLYSLRPYLNQREWSYIGTIYSKLGNSIYTTQVVLCTPGWGESVPRLPSSGLSCPWSSSLHLQSMGPMNADFLHIGPSQHTGGMSSQQPE